ncbi:MAG: hypothetical protein QOK15_2029 [Nocardioidaceae bacterium]|jgi:hypothetical protein|nr:hypothetical protein [Nocardioidaceae bacterium]
MRLRPALVSAALVSAGLGAVPATVAATDATPRPGVRFSSTDVVATTPVTVTVDPGTRPRGARFVLQRRYLDGWRTADRHAQPTRRGVVLDVPTDQFGRFRFRVAAVARSGDVVSASPVERVRVRPRYRPVGSSTAYVFSARPRIRWDSCRPIRWAFYPHHSPRLALRQLKDGFRRMHRATGLDFDYAGRTGHKPVPAGRDLPGIDVVVGWRTAQDYRAFHRHDDVVGVGGNSFYSGYQEADGTEVGKIFRGGVVLNADQDYRVTNGFGRGYTWGEVIEHELGHVVGLDHPDNTRQIMYYSVTRRNADWGAGDLAGLRQVGSVRGCLSRISGPQAAIGRSVARH